MSTSFLKWEDNELEVPQALFVQDCHIIAFSRAELTGLADRLHNLDWLAAVQTALATPRLLGQLSGGNRAWAVY